MKSEVFSSFIPRFHTLHLVLESYFSNSWRLNAVQPPEVFCKKRCCLRNFAKFTGKHLCQSLFFNKVASLTPANLFKKRHWHRCFPVNFLVFSRKPLLQNTSGRLLLWIVCKNNFYKLGMNNLYDSVKAMKIWKPIVTHTSCIIQIV